MKESSLTPIGDLASGYFDEFERRLAGVRSLIATERVDACDSGLCPEMAGENRIANNVASAMEKLRLQRSANMTDFPAETRKDEHSA